MKNIVKLYLKSFVPRFQMVEPEVRRGVTRPAATARRQPGVEMNHDETDGMSTSGGISQYNSVSNY